MKGLYNYTQKSSELVALYTKNGEFIYSNIVGVENLDIKEVLNSNKEDIYFLREIDGTHYMMFTSHWDINNKIIYIINAYDVQNIYNERDRELNSILITDIIILIVSSFVITIISAYLTRPIKILNKTSKQIALGKFNERVNIKSKDEIGELTESFNLMANQVENKIKELNFQVEQKNAFLNGFTHELKTPMTAILGYTNMLRLKKCDEELTKKALKFIYSETKRLETLSFKLMRLMGLSEEELNITDLNVFDFMNKIKNIETNILNKNEIILDVEPEILQGDSELLDIVMRNLVENASKSDPKDDIILIEGKKISNILYKISVIDKGRGIPKEHIKRVTEDFYMVDKSRSRKNNGSGIGLSLVKKILLFHDSKLDIESTEGVGTKVSFILKIKEDGR